MSKEITPKESLEKLKFCIGFIRQEGFYDQAYKCLEIINKALNTLEETNFNYHNALAFCEASKEEKQELHKQIEQLEKENQELKEKAKKYDEIVNLKTTPNIIEKSLADFMNKCIALEKENEKLEKVIEILKDKKVDLVILLFSNDFKEYNANITIRINGVTYLKGNNYTLTQQEYELLKEFLESE